MRVLNLSLDSSILDKNSVSAKRILEYGELVKKYFVIVPSKENKNLDLSDKVTVYGSGGNNRVKQLFNIYKKSKKIVKQKKCNVITAQDPFEVGLIGLSLAKKFKIGLNIQEHGDFFSQKYWRKERLLHFFRYFLGIFIIKRADSIRAVSQRIKKYLIENLKIKADKIVVVPVYTEILKLTKPQKEKNDKFIFLNLGRFVKQKNLPLLLNAFARVAKRHRQAKLLLIGRGSEKKLLKNTRAKLRIESQVEFLDWMDNIYDYFLRADAYVLSSNYEGWGRVIIEAAIARLPIIMTDVGCAGEAAVNEESALVSPVGSIDKLTQNMKRAMENQVLREKLAQNAFIALNKLPDKKKTLELYKKSWEIALKK
ncbi:MAG: glycosyltransferase family 4 protein [Patescibacteria group bacterium]|nr:glycosyltransferase family 4 protein [Patescibacteria group bacterium]